MIWLVRAAFVVGAWETMEAVGSAAAGCVVVYGMAVVAFGLHVWLDVEERTLSLWRFWAAQRDGAGHRVGFWLQVTAGAAASLFLIYVLAGALPFFGRYALGAGLGAMTLAVPMDLARRACSKD